MVSYVHCVEQFSVWGKFAAYVVNAANGGGGSHTNV